MKKALMGVGLSAMLLATACAAENGQAAAEEDADGEEAAEDCDVREFAMALRWQQQSAEAKTLQTQTFRLAAERLEELVDEADGEDLALISDLDETAVDNTELLARDMAECHGYSDWETWDHWEREGTARVIPGALEFFERADELGVTIFYLSDRTEDNFDDTAAMLQELDFPQADQEDQILLLGPPKQERRELVEADYELLMQLGDTLHDFHDGYAGADLEEQHELIEEHADRWGNDWFVFPNPTYGTWEEAELDEWDAEMEFGTYDEEGNH
ncbi:5'-nucleotidase, lipoprotein e(P4) family [Nesterenkonia suensis]